MADQQELILCECHSYDHQMIISKFDDEPEVIVGIHLSRKSFWKRLKYGIKYIFGYTSRFGAWDEFILSPENFKKIKDLVNE